MTDRRVFPGWWVVAGVFVMLFTTSGVVFYGLPVYLRSLATDLGFGVGQVSGATALFFLVSGLTGLPVAALLSRRDPRWLIAGGALVTGAVLSLFGRVTAVWQVYVLYALLGVGFAACSLVPGTTLVTRWFARRRALALSVASTGLSAGGVALTPFLATLVEREGLPAVAPWAGLLLVLGVLPVVVLLRSSPQSVGLQPDGDPAPPPSGTPEALPGALVGEAVRTRFFAAVTAAHALAMLAQVGGIAHVVNLVGERFDAALAATAVSLVAVCSLLGRLAGGIVAARTSQRGMALALMAAQAAALLGMVLLPGRAALLGSVVVFGLTVGNLLMLHPLLLAERFGVRDYGRVYSRSQLLATVGVAAGPAALGVLHDVRGDYVLAFSLAAGASLLAAVVLACSGPTRALRAPQPLPLTVPGAVGGAA